MSYLFYKHYLQAHVMPAGTGSPPEHPERKSTSKPPSEKFIKDRERCIDDELAASMPASDPPSWTLGGSSISKRKSH